MIVKSGYRSGCPHESDERAEGHEPTVAAVRRNENVGLLQELVVVLNN